MIEGKDIVVSNLGDCRAVLCRGKAAEALTEDHRAGQEEERRRIEDKVLMKAYLSSYSFCRHEGPNYC